MTVAIHVGAASSMDRAPRYARAIASRYMHLHTLADPTVSCERVGGLPCTERAPAPFLDGGLWL